MIRSKIMILALVALLMMIPLVSACDDDDETPTPVSTPTQPPVDTPTQPPVDTPTEPPVDIPTDPPVDTPTPTVVPTEPAEDIKITIGALTDVTGQAANAIIPVDNALEDVARYFNDNNLIPGVELDVIKYDGQFNPANDIPGYNYLIERGADVISTIVSTAAIVLKPLLEEDEMVMFSLVTSDEVINPPGWVFSTNVSGEPYKYTLLKWLAENDPDFPQDRPARIGAVGQGEYAATQQKGLKEYCEANTDKFEWVDGFLTEWTTVTFGPEVEALMDCDYIYPPSTGFFIGAFMGEYLDAGGQAKFLWDDAQAAYVGMIVDALGWDAIDGTIVSLLNGWWTDDFEMPNLANQVVNEYRSDELDAMRWAGVSYFGGFMQSYITVSILAEAINSVGPENFNSQVLYDTAESFSMTPGGGALWDFSPTKRSVPNAFGIYECSAEAEDLVRLDPDWQTLIYEP